MDTRTFIEQLLTGDKMASSDHSIISDADVTSWEQCRNESALLDLAGHYCDDELSRNDRLAIIQDVIANLESVIAKKNMTVTEAKKDAIITKEELEAMYLAELKEFAEENNIELSDSRKRAYVLNDIKKALGIE